MYAAMYNRIGCAKVLLQFGANLGTLDNLGRDAMTYAKMDERETFIKLLKDFQEESRETTNSSLSSSSVGIENSTLFINLNLIFSSSVDTQLFIEIGQFNLHHSFEIIRATHNSSIHRFYTQMLYN